MVVVVMSMMKMMVKITKEAGRRIYPSFFLIMMRLTMVAVVMVVIIVHTAQFWCISKI